MMEVSLVSNLKQGNRISEWCNQLYFVIESLLPPTLTREKTGEMLKCF